MNYLKSAVLGCMALAVTACQSTSDHTVTGVYATRYENEYAMGNDTIIVTAYNRSARTYEIEKRTGYQKIRHGKILPKEYAHKKWMAQYDPEKQVLQETVFGRQLFLNPGKKELTMGETHYRRVE
ncbi:hypothetical protein [Mucilaginibacter kameinonensis]|uniref:hypothetical protein n=1 Tax=Mucilaginibacter kameinonensis TaxID=452286 RepID=UPI0013CF1D1D|nr:hypothetical protein [Mucilaginibacter kameinonensis]